MSNVKAKLSRIGDLPSAQVSPSGSNFGSFRAAVFVSVSR
ncbi:hypothetical protein H4W81_000355 [Nonomuraea africana]|uniref:Uncharacterized protein n=1 Tax=Nonomuraea africana TaxID=46171 RepID=A0ABR9K6Z7_9ACTN|nr:hypothetical protein [Nonomuraea africana]